MRVNASHSFHFIDIACFTILISNGIRSMSTNVEHVRGRVETEMTC